MRCPVFPEAESHDPEYTWDQPVGMNLLQRLRFETVSGPAFLSITPLPSQVFATCLCRILSGGIVT